MSHHTITIGASARSGYREKDFLRKNCNPFSVTIQGSSRISMRGQVCFTGTTTVLDGYPPSIQSLWPLAPHFFIDRTGPYLSDPNEGGDGKWRYQTTLYLVQFTWANQKLSNYRVHLGGNRRQKIITTWYRIKKVPTKEIQSAIQRMMKSMPDQQFRRWIKRYPPRTYNN